MNAIVNFRLCTLTDDELIEKVNEITDKMYTKPHKIPLRHIPARPNEDYDLLIGELLVRFKEKIQDQPTEKEFGFQNSKKEIS